MWFRLQHYYLISSPNLRGKWSFFANFKQKVKLQNELDNFEFERKNKLKMEILAHTVNLGYNELGYNELSVITNIFLSKIGHIVHKLIRL
jgi:hypothetical protein